MNSLKEYSVVMDPIVSTKTMQSKCNAKMWALIVMIIGTIAVNIVLYRALYLQDVRIQMLEERVADLSESCKNRIAVSEDKENKENGRNEISVDKFGGSIFDDFIVKGDDVEDDAKKEVAGKDLRNTPNSEESVGDFYQKIEIQLDKTDTMLSRRKRSANNERHRERRNLAKRQHSLHVVMHLPALSSQKNDLAYGLVTHIELSHGRLYKNGYQPYRNHNGAGSGSCHTYREWADDPHDRMDRHISYDNYTGHIIVTKSGYYFVYGQIYYNSVGPRNTFQIRHRKPDSYPPCRAGCDRCDDDVIAMCVSTVSLFSFLGTVGNNTSDYSTCYTGSVVYLERNSEIYMEDWYSTKIFDKPGANYFGIFKI